MGTAVLSAFENHSVSGLVRQGLAGEPVPAGLATGIRAIDSLLPGGGLPEGRITELVGRRSAGKLSLALAFAARVMARGEAAALLDPEATVLPDVRAEPALAHLLVVRGGGTLVALRAADALLKTGAFPLLVLDLPGRATVAPDGRSISTAMFVRLAREERASGTALVVVSEWLPWRVNGLASLVSLRLEVRRPCRPSGCSALEVVVAKSKLGGEGGRAAVDLEVGS